MKLNRRARRASKVRPNANQSPADQMKAFLKSPGKFHIVQLPDDKSFVVKVTDAEMPIFTTMCLQLRGVLGQCEAIPATPVDASVATTQQMAESSAESTLKIREARARQEDAEAAEGEAAEAKFAGLKQRVGAARESESRRRGRHAKHEPDTVFDQLAAGADADDEEARKQLAAMEIAAAQDRVARVQDEAEKANAALREAMERGGEIHNASVIERFAAKAGDAIAEKLDLDDDTETLDHAAQSIPVEPRPPTEHVTFTDQLTRLQQELATALQRGDHPTAGTIRNEIFALRTRSGQNAV